MEIDSPPGHKRIEFIARGALMILKNHRESRSIRNEKVFARVHNDFISLEIEWRDEKYRTKLKRAIRDNPNLFPMSLETWLVITNDSDYPYEQTWEKRVYPFKDYDDTNLKKVYCEAPSVRMTRILFEKLLLKRKLGADKPKSINFPMDKAVGLCIQTQSLGTNTCLYQAHNNLVGAPIVSPSHYEWIEKKTGGQSTMTNVRKFVASVARNNKPILEITDQIPVGEQSLMNILEAKNGIFFASTIVTSLNYRILTTEPMIESFLRLVGGFVLLDTNPGTSSVGHFLAVIYVANDFYSSDLLAKYGINQGDIYSSVTPMGKCWVVINGMEKSKSSNTNNNNNNNDGHVFISPNCGYLGRPKSLSLLMEEFFDKRSSDGNDLALALSFPIFPILNDDGSEPTRFPWYRYEKETKRMNDLMVLFCKLGSYRSELLISGFFSMPEMLYLIENVESIKSREEIHCRRTDSISSIHYEIKDKISIMTNRYKETANILGDKYEYSSDELKRMTIAAQRKISFEFESIEELEKIPNLLKIEDIDVALRFLMAVNENYITLPTFLAEVVSFESVHEREEFTFKLLLKLMDLYKFDEDQLIDALLNDRLLSKRNRKDIADFMSDDLQDRKSNMITLSDFVVKTWNDRLLADINEDDPNPLNALLRAIEHTSAGFAGSGFDKEYVLKTVKELYARKRNIRLDAFKIAKFVEIQTGNNCLSKLAVEAYALGLEGTTMKALYHFNIVREDCLRALITHTSRQILFSVHKEEMTLSRLCFMLILACFYVFEDTSLEIRRRIHKGMNISKTVAETLSFYLSPGRILANEDEEEDFDVNDESERAKTTYFDDDSTHHNNLKIAMEHKLKSSIEEAGGSLQEALDIILSISEYGPITDADEWVQLLLSCTDDEFKLLQEKINDELSKRILAITDDYSLFKTQNTKSNFFPTIPNVSNTKKPNHPNQYMLEELFYDLPFELFEIPTKMIYKLGVAQLNGKSLFVEKPQRPSLNYDNIKKTPIVVSKTNGKTLWEKVTNHFKSEGKIPFDDTRDLRKRAIIPPDQ